MPIEYCKDDSTKQYTCSEPDCTFKTFHQNTMYYHMKSKHLNEMNYECEHCKKKFVQKATLDSHLLAKHNNEKKDVFACSEKGCAFTSLTQGNCRIHWMRIHNKNSATKIYDKKEHSCTKCSKTFKGMTSFYYHAYECLGLKNEFCKPIL